MKKNNRAVTVDFSVNRFLKHEIEYPQFQILERLTLCINVNGKGTVPVSTEMANFKIS